MAASPAQPAHVAPATVVLAPGAGYRSDGGSSSVHSLQRRLARVGYNPGPIDGRYGPLTEEAVVRFQTARDLPVDGIAGAITLSALRGPSGVYPGMGYRSAGSRRVRVVQRELARAGYAPGPIDGRYGPRTEQAVADFEVANGLRVDGLADPTVLARLRALARARSTRAASGVRQPARPASGQPARPLSGQPAQPATGHPARPATGHPALPPRQTPTAAAWTPLRRADRSTDPAALIALGIALAIVMGLATSWTVARGRRKRYAEQLSAAIAAHQRADEIRYGAILRRARAGASAVSKWRQRPVAIAHERDEEGQR
ncbi:MAG: peptidoglycan-binding protein [Solirubrobacterales bacterium]|nr:peptidoglycan-binding protein [Solirubrobacterales bacterium]MBV9714183.1 peptidoglycan-binding protein [Solirubrobacterales bacterium]